jgi:hypothetical protein
VLVLPGIQGRSAHRHRDRALCLLPAVPYVRKVRNELLRQRQPVRHRTGHSAAYFDHLALTTPRRQDNTDAAPALLLNPVPGRMKCYACGNHGSWLVAHTLADGTHLGGRPACDEHRDTAWPDPEPGSTTRFIAQPPAEPLRRGTRMRDKNDHTWVRGNTRWTCTAPVDGAAVHSVGRLRWSDLWRMYGPLVPS